MPGPSNPHSGSAKPGPQQTGSHLTGSDEAQRERERQRERDRQDQDARSAGGAAGTAPDWRREGSREDSRGGGGGGRPQDDRDPNSPSRTTQRPPQSEAMTSDASDADEIERENENEDADEMEMGTGGRKADPKTDQTGNKPGNTGRTGNPGQPPRQI